MTPEEGLSFGLYMPLLLGGVLYTVLLLLGAWFESRGGEHAETARNAAFVVILAAAAYAVVLALVAVVSEIGMIEDLLTIMFVVGLFFLLLAVVLLLAEMGIGALGRRRRRGR
jgi:hypothetical protein